ncbi:hypothetical protein A2971_02485 [Candidatus Gottesmanbacteria bacterium RIFCSPLOWO2_01_FULL_46_21]|uniref:Glycosyltransferase RgtA/B/C/D-like domain-containing protein n=1 Tax=Candidatus Gottesmanbacteria bacterium RIFCSPLOWO2_01_FULL_46_21 TaxID=1798393 RepID=A0A1F6AY29_9BACT|nr:MAG: hypothetical protein A2971_02485 [Candidatus Gottesmanbacteria bacterium RIFCSPLOWO2_01_FULL_46_21]
MQHNLANHKSVLGKEDLFFIITLILLCGYAYRLLPQINITSDGFMHLYLKSLQALHSWNYWLAGFDVGATLFGAILVRLFGSNIEAYLWFELGVILFIDLLFYLLVKTITKSSIIAFVSSLIAGVSYFGTWNVYGTPCYCFFLERVVNMPFIITSFIFLHLFLETERIRFIGLSLLLFFFGVGLGHVELIITPAFMVYPVIWYVIHKRSKFFIDGVLVGTAYISISGFFTRMQRLTFGNWGTEWTFLEFFLNSSKYDYFKASALQLVHWSQYPPLSILLSSNPFSHISIPGAQKSIPLVLTIYLLTMLYIYKNVTQHRAIIVTSVIGVLGITLLNSYVKLPEIIVPNSNRYLYFPTFFLSIFWAIVLWYTFLKHAGVRFYVGVTILGSYYLANVILIDNIIHENFKWSESTRAIFTYVRENRYKLEPNTLVVVSWPEFWVQEAHFFTEQLGKGEVTYATEITNMSDWKTLVPQNDHVIMLRYNTECACVKETKIK